MTLNERFVKEAKELEEVWKTLGVNGVINRAHEKAELCPMVLQNHRITGESHEEIHFRNNN